MTWAMTTTRSCYFTLGSARTSMGRLSRLSSGQRTCTPRSSSSMTWSTTPSSCGWWMVPSLESRQCKGCRKTQGPSRTTSGTSTSTSASATNGLLLLNLQPLRRLPKCRLLQRLLLLQRLQRHTRMLMTWRPLETVGSRQALAPSARWILAQPA